MGRLSTIVAVTKVFQNGKTTIPKEVRSRFNINDGETIVWSLDETGRLVVSKGTLSRAR